nr:heme exporter protein CcmD [Microbulbifer sediminum]
MNGHGPYVWAAYGITLLAMAGLIVQPLLARRQLRREFRREQRIHARRAGRRQPGRRAAEGALAE